MFGAIGPLLGGFLVQAVSWRLVFVINLPLGVAAMAATRHIPETAPHQVTGRLDVSGPTLAVLGLGGVTYGLIQGAADGWTSPPILLSLILGAGLLVGFLFNEARHPSPVLGSGADRPRWGTGALREEGWEVNASGCSGSGARRGCGCPRRRKRRRLGSHGAGGRLRAERPNHVWAWTHATPPRTGGPKAPECDGPETGRRRVVPPTPWRARGRRRRASSLRRSGWWRGVRRVPSGPALRVEWEPLGVFRSRVFSGVNAATLAIYAALGTVTFLVVLQLQQVLGYSPLAAGVSLLPVTLILLAFATYTGKLAGAIGPRIPMTAGALLAAAGMAMFERATRGASFVTAILPASVVFGIGLVLTVPALTITALGALSRDRAGVASAINNEVARVASLAAVALIPALAGLRTGGAHVVPSSFSAGFGTAIWICAGLCASGGLISLLTMPGAPRPAPPAEREAEAGGAVPR